ncbi:MAG: ABC transporter ATP-binding protein [Deltaproteobacteria bacterium]|nr:ABC transporter ATP-binding protein [Deltaproteobacteria bacterium]
MAEIELKRISKGFLGGTVAALREMDLKIPDGAFTAVLGPSGCGKTTLLRIIAGLEQPDAGEVLIGGRVANHVPPPERNVAMVFQNYALYPHKRVFENIAIGLRLRRYPKEEIRAKVNEVSRILRIEDLMERYPKQLSGGQQQRVALARALVRKPEVFLLDEPLSNLDAQVRDSTRTELRKLFRELNATVLYVTHDQTEAMMMSDFLVVMDAGAIRQAGDPIHIYKEPGHRFVAEFIGTHRINTVAGRLENGRFKSTDGAIVLDTMIRKTGDVLMEIRPEHIAHGSREDITLEGETLLVEPMGPTNLVSVRVGENELKMFLSSPPRVGEPMRLSFSSRKAYFFEAQSGLRL